MKEEKTVYFAGTALHFHIVLQYKFKFPKVLQDSFAIIVQDITLELRFVNASPLPFLHQINCTSLHQIN